MNYVNRRINPRLNRTFPVTLVFTSEFSSEGRAVEPSAYGATVEISEYKYNCLRENPALWIENRRITVFTRLNEIAATVGSLRIGDNGRYLLSLKLLDGRAWY